LPQHADAAQQAFSSDHGPSLHLALPALEVLHKAWTQHSEDLKYFEFENALEEGINKVLEYYSKTSNLNAFHMALCALSMFLFLANAYVLQITVLDPRSKMRHFDKHWDSSLKRDDRDQAEEIASIIQL